MVSQSNNRHYRLRLRRYTCRAALGLDASVRPSAVFQGLESAEQSFRVKLMLTRIDITSLRFPEERPLALSVFSGSNLGTCGGDRGVLVGDRWPEEYQYRHQTEQWNASAACYVVIAMLRV